MLIRILRTIGDAEGHVGVWFNSEVGDCYGIWREPAAPELFREYHVELDIPHVLRWNDDLRPASQGVESISFHQGAITICVRVESVEADGCLTVRLADDLIFLETEGVPASVSGYVAVHPRLIQLYDMHL